MKGIWFPVMLVTAFLAIYTALAWFSFDAIVLGMFALSPFLMIWMVYSVLKHGKPSGASFNEKFYDDWDYKRIADTD